MYISCQAVFVLGYISSQSQFNFIEVMLLALHVCDSNYCCIDNLW